MALTHKPHAPQARGSRPNTWWKETRQRRIPDSIILGIAAGDLLQPIPIYTAPTRAERMLASGQKRHNGEPIKKGK